jgi:hypothetical protein
MKPPSTYKSDAVDTGGDWYDGPPPPPALYKGKVKMMLLSKVASGDNKGEQRIMVLCEITEGKYKGAGVTKWLQLTEQGSPWVNQFLRSLTDGSDAQFKGIREAFEQVGYTVGDPDAKKRLPIIKIGKKTNPVGMPTSFVTKLRTNPEDQVTRAEISRFVTPFVEASEDDDNGEATTETDDFESDGLDEFAEDSTENPEPEADSSTTADADDDDDPWSV